MRNPVQLKTLAKRNTVKRALSIRPWKAFRKGKKVGEESEQGDETRSMEVPADEIVQRGEKQVTIEEPTAKEGTEKADESPSPAEVPEEKNSDPADAKRVEAETEIKVAPTETPKAPAENNAEVQTPEGELMTVQEPPKDADKAAVDEVAEEGEVPRQTEAEVEVEIASPLSNDAVSAPSEEPIKNAINTVLENQASVGQPNEESNGIPAENQALSAPDIEVENSIPNPTQVPTIIRETSSHTELETTDQPSEAKNEHAALPESQLPQANADTATQVQPILPSPAASQTSVDNTPLQQVTTDAQSPGVVEDASSQPQQVTEDIASSSHQFKHEEEEHKEVAPVTPETATAPAGGQEELYPEDADWQIIRHDQAVDQENTTDVSKLSSVLIAQEELKGNAENLSATSTMVNLPQTEEPRTGDLRPDFQIAPLDLTKLSPPLSQSRVMEERSPEPRSSSLAYPKSLPSSPVATDPLLSPSPFVRNSPPHPQASPKAEVTPQTSPSPSAPSRSNVTRDLSYPPGPHVVIPTVDDDAAPIVHLPCLSMPSMFLPVPNVRVVWVSYRVSWWLATPINYLLYPYRAMCRRIL